MRNIIRSLAIVAALAAAPALAQVPNAGSPMVPNSTPGGGGGGSGTVTSFSSGDLAPLFTTGVANPTTTPALSFVKATPAQNLVLAGPASGGAGAWLFRSLVVADLPTSIPNANLANAATTVNGQTCTLGAACTVTGAPSGAAGGDLAGTYPNPTLAWISRGASQTLNIGAGGTLGGIAFVTPGTGVATALGVNVGSGGAFVVLGGALGTPSSGVATNLTGTAAGLTAGNVTTNANLTGPISSSGNATSITSQTGTGTKFVVDTGPTITNLSIGAGSAITSSGPGGALGSNAFTSTAYLPLTGGTLTGMLGINLNGASLLSPQTGTVLQIANADGVATRLELDSFGAQAFLSGVCAAGTKASPTTLTADTQCGGFNMFGYNGTAYAGPAATFRTFAAQTWAVGAQGSYAEVATTANGGTALASRMRWENDGGITVPSTVTGGSQGVGTINATNLYVAGVAVMTAASTNTLINKTFDTAGTGNSLSIAGVAVTANTGTGAVARATAPSFVTPSLGVATATSINGNTFTTGTYTLTGAAGKTLTFSNSITLAGTDATTMTFPTTSATIARTDAGQTFTGQQVFSSIRLTTTTALQLQTGNTFIFSPSAAVIQHGTSDVDTAPVAQIIRSQGALAGGTSNVAGANFTFLASPGKGTGAGGSFIFQTTPAGSTGTVVGTATTALTIDSTQSAIFAGTADASSTTTGAVQIAGGMSITKRVFTAGLTASSGLQTAVLCLSSSNEIIADSVACLASSERFKQDISPSDLGLSAVMAMRPITYRYAETGNARFDKAPNQRDIHAGFRAEDVAAIDRRLVAFDADGAVRTVRQDGITAVLVRAVQELKADNDNLRAEVARQRAARP